jgi:hypothetical protein
MQTTIDIDEDILQAAEERARFTGRTTNAVIAEVLRQGFGMETIELPPLRNGLPQIRFDPAFEPTADAILDLLEKVEETDDLGPPLFIPTETRKWIDQKAAERQTGRGTLASALAQESLLAQDKWPARHGVPQILRRSNDSSVITMELIDQLMDEMD